MLRHFLKTKLHPLTVTATELHYDGSITLGAELVREAGLQEYEKVLVVDINNGSRFETYLITGEEGKVCVNGAAARLVNIGDQVIVMSFVILNEKETDGFKPVNLRISPDNRAANTIQ